MPSKRQILGYWGKNAHSYVDTDTIPAVQLCELAGFGGEEASGDCGGWMVFRAQNKAKSSVNHRIFYFLLGHLQTFRFFLCHLELIGIEMFPQLRTGNSNTDRLVI